MGKINASKSQKEEAIVEQSEEGQVEQETEDNVNSLYSNGVSNGSSLNSGASISNLILLPISFVSLNERTKFVRSPNT
jgi:hypothetical protein